MGTILSCYLLEGIYTHIVIDNINTLEINYERRNQINKVKETYQKKKFPDEKSSAIRQ